MSEANQNSIEASHRRLASNLIAELEVLKASIEIIRVATARQNDFSSDAIPTPTRHAILILAFRVVNDTEAAVFLLERGYFVQAASLYRDLAEIGMLALYFSENPDKVSVWLQLQGNKRYNSFGRRNLRNDVNDKEKFKWLNQRFDHFSEFGTHPSPITIAAHHDGEKFYSGPHFNPELFTNMIKDLATLTWHVTDACGYAYRALFRESFEEHFPSELHRFSEAWNTFSSAK